MVVDAEPKNTMPEDTRRSERRSALINSLTEPALLEMFGSGLTVTFVAAARQQGYLSEREARDLDLGGSNR